MFKSIRWTLQLWHAAILMLALIGFGAATYYGIQRARFAEIDASLAATVHQVATQLRGPPPRQRFDAGGPPSRREDGAGPPPGRGDGRDDFGRPPDGPPPDDRPPNDRPPENRAPGDRPQGDGPPEDRQPRETDFSASFLARFGGGNDDLPYFVIWRPKGEMFKASAASLNVPYPGAGPLPLPGAQLPPHYRQRAELREAYVMTPQGQCILAGRSIAVEQTDLRRLAWLLIGTGGGILALGLAGGAILSARAVRPIRSISSIAGTISGSDLSRRIDVAGTASELGMLAEVLNAMFDRLETAFQQQARFTADASHELRTPIAVIHSHAELALSRERTAEEYRRTIETCLRASGRMKGLIESLLLLARADVGKLELERKPFDLGLMTGECVALVGPLAEEKSVVLDAELPPAEVVGDSVRLAQVVTNLLTNAIRYNREGGKIRVAVGTENGHALVIVSDTGVGISEADRQHVFERFFRVDKARTREAGGAGLGLSICKTIVEAHGGSISVEGNAEEGTTFTVRLPATKRLAGEKRIANSE